jgi:hypothetical protein
MEKSNILNSVRNSSCQILKTALGDVVSPVVYRSFSSKSKMGEIFKDGDIYLKGTDALCVLLDRLVK